MATASFTGGLTFKMGDGASPEVFTAIEEVRSLGGFGKTNPLIDATSHDSTAKEYIAGLADGAEITVECLRVHESPASEQDDLITAVNNGTTKNFQVILTNGTLSKTYSFAAVCLSWNITPSYDDANMISFSLKISGDITVA